MKSQYLEVKEVRSFLEKISRSVDHRGRNSVVNNTATQSLTFIQQWTFIK